MKNGTNLMESLSRLDTLCTAGYAVALHISFTTPRFLFQTYSRDWMEIYSKKGLVLKDPTVLWGFSNVGVARWSNLEEIDDSKILPMAREFGLKYGFTFAVERDSSRSIASFARSDRDFSDKEVDEISDIIHQLHNTTIDIKDLSENALQQLKKLSVIYTRG